MKVIQMMPEFGLAGAEIMCENLTYALRDQGIEVVIISMYDFHSAITDRLESAGFKIIYLNKKPGLDFSMIWKMKKVFKQERPDVIHTHRYVMQYAIPAAILAGVKRRIHTLHSVATVENTPSARKVNKIFYKINRVVPVALSELVKDTIIEEYNLPSDKIPVILNGVDLGKCIPKESYKLHEPAKILHVGRFCDVKNHKGLINAFNLLQENNSNTELMFLGDGEERESIENQINELGLGEKIKLPGVQSDVHPFLTDADIFILSSIHEGVPMSIIEAMATGLPIVATAVGGVPDMLENGKDALLTEVDETAMCEALKKLLTDEELRQRLGKNAIAKSNEFSAAHMAKQYIKLYTDGTL